MVMVMPLVIVMLVVVMVMALVMVMLVSVVIVMLVVVVVTEVLGKDTTCLTIIATATLSSRRANLIPRQALGPWPKAWKAWGKRRNHFLQ